MNWQLIFRNEYRRLNINKKSPAFPPIPYILIPNIFLPNESLAIEVNSKKAKPTWKAAGILQEISIDTPGKAVSGEHKLNLAEKKVLILNSQNRFQLQFNFYNWLENLSISIWRDNDMPLSFAENTIQNPNSVTVTQKTVTTTASIVAAVNANRRGLTVYNVGNAAIYIGYSASVSSTSNFSFIIPKGGVYEFLDPVETCDIYAITANGTASIEVTEKSIV